MYNLRFRELVGNEKQHFIGNDFCALSFLFSFALNLLKGIGKRAGAFRRKKTLYNMEVRSYHGKKAIYLLRRSLLIQPRKCDDINGRHTLPRPRISTRKNQ